MSSKARDLVVTTRRTSSIAMFVSALLCVSTVPVAAQSTPPPTVVPSDPNVYTAAPSVLFDLGSRFLRRIEDETAGGNVATKNPGGGGAPAEQVERRFRTWAEGYGVVSRLDDTDGMPGDARRTWGLVGGIAYNPAPGTTLGFAIDQGWTKVEMNGLPQSGRINLIQFGANASFELGAWTFGFAAIHGRGDVHTRNATSTIGGMTGVALADYGAKLWGAIAETSYYVAVGNGRILPKLGFDWQHTRTDAFTEAGIVNPLTVAGQTAWRVRGFAGVEVGHTWSAPGTMFDLAGYARAVEILDQELAVAVVTGGGAPPATFQSIGESRFGIDAGASASLSLAETLRIYALYDGRFRSNFVSHGGTLGVEVRF